MFPERAVLRNPRLRLLKRPYREPAVARAPPLFLPDESGPLENPEVLQHRGETHPVRAGQFRNGSLSAGQGGHHRAPCGIRQGLENRVQSPVMLNHSVY